VTKLHSTAQIEKTPQCMRLKLHSQCKAPCRCRVPVDHRFVADVAGAGSILERVECFFKVGVHCGHAGYHARAAVAARWAGPLTTTCLELRKCTQLHNGVKALSRGSGQLHIGGSKPWLRLSRGRGGEGKWGICSVSLPCQGVLQQPGELGVAVRHMEMPALMPRLTLAILIAGPGKIMSSGK